MLSVTELRPAVRPARPRPPPRAPKLKVVPPRVRLRRLRRLLMLFLGDFLERNPEKCHPVQIQGKDQKEN